ncbi:unnamed protein product [Echinostoma caproni]|uniref:PseudoU_synth_2 domain-containing protein n=1 Tax=Echinostoma caproni TaxID=27848 RepID=A0A183AZ89_9TREM|nr:unnamed protein product [Echinostoma caproni]
MVGKQYLALVWGHVGVRTVPCDPETVHEVRPNVYLVQMGLGSIDHQWPCGREQKLVAPFTDPRCRNVRDCSTIVVVLEHGRVLGEPASRLLLIPKTGRRHQLRVHCAAGLGHPIVGDLSYSPWPFISQHNALNHDSSLDYRLNRMMLHAYRLNMIIRSQREGALVHHHRDRKGFLHDTLVDKHQVLDLCTGDPNFFPSDSHAWSVETELHSLSQWRDTFTL